MKNILVLSVFFLFFGINDAQSLLNCEGCLTINRIVINSDQSYSLLEYEFGKNLYDHYSIEGLPENFLIKTEPDLIFTTKSIEKIIINDQFISPMNEKIIYVDIFFNHFGSNQIYEYTKNNINKRVAIIINGNVYSVPGIISSVKERIRIRFKDLSLGDVYKILNSISKNISVSIGVEDGEKGHDPVNLLKNDK